MRVGFAIVIILMITVVAPSAEGTKIENCLTKDADAGTLYCNKVCKASSLGSYCTAPEAGRKLGPGAYCWQAVLYATPTQACFEGEWDECCATMGGF